MATVLNAIASSSYADFSDCSTQAMFNWLVPTGRSRNSNKDGASAHPIERALRIRARSESYHCCSFLAQSTTASKTSSTHLGAPSKRRSCGTPHLREIYCLSKLKRSNIFKYYRSDPVRVQSTKCNCERASRYTAR